MENPALVIDHDGSAFMRAGFAGDEVPAVCKPSVASGGSGLAATHVWSDAFTELGVSPSHHHILLADAAGNQEGRNILAEIFFEQFEAPGLYFVEQPILALASEGCTSGLVVDLAYNTTRIVPVHDGKLLRLGFDAVPAGTTHGMAGRQLAAFMASMVQTAAPGLTEAMLLPDIYHLAYVASNFPAECAACTANPAEFERTYVLPDGKELRIGAERFRCGEALFDPAIAGNAGLAGLHHTVHDVLERCDGMVPSQTRGSPGSVGGGQLAQNVLLVGDGAHLDGVAARLQTGVSALLPSMGQVFVRASAAGGAAPWVGGSIIASMLKPEQWVSLHEYSEEGPSVVQRKCGDWPGFQSP
jgi:actin beta/gamma 1